MFSFHKPKVYRSSTGCCICKAKSSSSRFTDSKKYEDDFIECFQLLERRTGEICNACVLLVKRWKKLPAGSDRNWSHVVDARAGPGIKSLTKFKSKNKKKIKETQDKHEKIIKKKHVYLKPDREREQSPAMSDDYTEDFIPHNEGGGSKNSSRAGSPVGSDDGLTGVKRLAPEPAESGLRKRLPQLSVSGFIDMTYFKRETICCGTIFKGPYGEVMIDPSLLKPCIGCIAHQERKRQVINAARNSPSHSSASASPSHSLASASPSHSLASASPAHSVDSAVESTVQKPMSAKSFSDSSSDSGYDESSNQGVGESKLAKIINNSPSPITIATKQQQQQQEIKAIIPIENVQLETIPVSEAIRLDTDSPIKLVPLKQVDQILYTPITLASPAIVTTNNTNSSSHQNINIVSNPLVDFAIHASARQSIAN